MRFNRITEFDKSKDYQIIKPRPDFALQEVKMIDDNGKIVSQSKRVLVDYHGMIARIPAFTTKIEYMQQYGTVDPTNIVKYSFAPRMSEHDVLKLRNQIISSNYVLSEVKPEVKSEVKSEIVNN